MPLEARVFLNPETMQPMDLAEFLDLAEHSLASVTVLTLAASYWKVPVTSTVETSGAIGIYDSTLRNLNGLAWTLLRDGPIGEDRSAFLFKLAVACDASGLEPGEAVAIVREADDRHTQKYVGRRDADKRYAQTVQRAYS